MRKGEYEKWLGSKMDWEGKGAAQVVTRRRAVRWCAVVTDLFGELIVDQHYSPLRGRRNFAVPYLSCPTLVRV